MPKINRILVTYWHVCAFNKGWSWIQSIERRLPLLYSLYMLTKTFFFFLNLKKIQNGPSSKCNRDNLPCHFQIHFFFGVHNYTFQFHGYTIWNQANHRFTTTVQRRFYGHATNALIRPLDEGRAVQLASELFGELFVFTVIAIPSLILYPHYLLQKIIYVMQRHMQAFTITHRVRPNINSIPFILMRDAEASRSKTRLLLENKKQKIFASENYLKSTRVP